MTLNRYARKRDTVEPEILELLEGVGRVVVVMDRPLDLVCESRCECGRKGWMLLEVKTGNKPLQPNQRAFIEMCEEKGLPVAVVRSDADALEAIG